MTQFELIARMRVRAGMLEQFRSQAAECIRLAVARDVGTLRYDWFLSRDGTQCEVRESYADSESLLEHRANVRDAYEGLSRFAQERVTSVYGEPSLQLVRLADCLGAGVTWFSLFRGLTPSGPRD